MSSSGAAEPFVAGVKLSAEELANAATGPAHAMPDFSASRFTVLNYFRGESLRAGGAGYVVGSSAAPLRATSLAPVTDSVPDPCVCSQPGTW